MYFKSSSLVLCKCIFKPVGYTTLESQYLTICLTKYKHRSAGTTMGIFFNGKCRSKARLDGKVVIVTGSNTGIGKETVADLAKRGAEVIMACRNMEKAEAAADDIRKRVLGANIVVMKLDLSSLTSVREFCQEFTSKYKFLHLLINNAGVMMCPRSLTEDGYETQFATNHLGHFLLTLLLLPTIIRSAPARIINVSSKAHIFCSSMSFNNINYEKNYSSITAYARSKLANILFTLELANRLKDKDVIVASLHPGVVDTELQRHLGTTIFPGVPWMSSKFGWWLMKSPTQGAQTTLHCALDDSIKSGSYYDDCVETSTSRTARDTELAKELWNKSIELVKLHDFDPFSNPS